MFKTLTFAAAIALTGVAAQAQTSINFYAVEIAIQETVTTQVGPFGTAAECEGQRDTIRDDIARGFEVYASYGQNASQWGVNAIVMLDDYSVECVQLTHVIN